MVDQMEYVQLTDRDRIEEYLNSHPGLFVYSLGDLDDDFWPHTTWFGAVDNGKIRAICLIFTMYETPLVQAISEPENKEIHGLLSAIASKMPDTARIHFTSSAVGALAETCELSDLVSGWKMALQVRSKLANADFSGVRRLGIDDVSALQDLYESVHQNSTGSHLFVPSMLDVGPHFGVKVNGQIISAAGVHVYSPRFGVAAVANVATHPEYRGRGLAKAVTAHLCRELITDVEHIGLNVEGNNGPALQAYKRIGFEPLTEFFAANLQRRR